MRMRIVGILILALTLGLPGVAGATHTDGNAANGTFDPKFTASVATPISDRPSNATIGASQADHEDAVRILYIRGPAESQLTGANVPVSQNADGTTATICDGPLGPPDADGLRFVQRAEKIGTFSASAVADAVAPRTSPIVYNGDLYQLAWPQQHSLGLSLSTTTGPSPTITATWNAVTDAASYDVRIKRFPGAFNWEQVNVATTSHNFTTFLGAPLVEGSEYTVNVRARNAANVVIADYGLNEPMYVTGGAATQGQRAIWCGRVTTTDARIQQLAESGVADIRQLSVPFPVRIRQDGRFEVTGDLSSIVGNTSFTGPGVAASILSVSTTIFGRSAGNWAPGPVTVNRNPALAVPEPNSQVYSLEAEFHPCHAHDQEAANPCGSGPATNKGDVTRTVPFTIYPQHAKPTVSGATQSGNTFDVAWGPHAFSHGAADTAGWAFQVIPVASDSGTPNVAACHAAAVICRTSASPVPFGATTTDGDPDADGWRAVVAANGTTDFRMTKTGGPFVLRIWTVYSHSRTSADTDLGSVKGFAEEFLGFPLVYFDPAARDTLGTPRPARLMIKPDTKLFFFQFGTTSFLRTADAMPFQPSGEDPSEGTGSLSYTQKTVGGVWNLTAVFDPAAARGVWASQSATTIRFNGVRV